MRKCRPPTPIRQCLLNPLLNKKKPKTVIKQKQCLRTSVLWKINDLPKIWPKIYCKYPSFSSFSPPPKKNKKKVPSQKKKESWQRYWSISNESFSKKQNKTKHVNALLHNAKLTLISDESVSGRKILKIGHFLIRSNVETNNVCFHDF